MIKNIIISIFFWLAIVPSSIVLAQKVKAVPSLDLTRYVGKWYEIARLPNRFQTSCADNVTAEYRTRTDGNIDVINRCRKADGSVEVAAGMARVLVASAPAGSATNSKLQVRFAPAWLSWIAFVWGDYWVLALAPDYSYAVVGEPGRKYCWILSRSSQLPEATYQIAVAAAAAQGFAVSQLVKTKQD